MVAKIVVAKNTVTRDFSGGKKRGLRFTYYSLPQTSLIFLIFALRVGNSPTWEGPGYATDQLVILLLGLRPT